MSERTNSTVVCGDALSVLRDWPEGYFDCCITSPPYWGLRDYGTPPLVWDGREGCEHEWGDTLKTLKHKSGEKNPGKEYWYKDKGASDDSGSSFCSRCGAWRGSLGLEPDFRDYIRHLMQIMEQVKRVLKPEGTAWINLGDSYSGGKGQSSQAWSTAHTDREGTLQKPQHQISSMGETRPADYPQIAKPKSLCAIPDRFKIAMIDTGWICRNEIVWYKRNCMPSSAKDRFTVDFEKVFFFTKQGKYYFKQQLEPAMGYDGRKDIEYKGGQKDMAGGAHERWHFKNLQEGGKPFSPHSLHEKRLNGEEYLSPIRNMRCVWDIPTKPSSEPHFAMFPDTLVTPMLLAGCPEGGIVLDPFGGMATVGLVAERLGMDSVCIELSEVYAEKAEVRIVNKRK